MTTTGDLGRLESGFPIVALYTFGPGAAPVPEPSTGALVVGVLAVVVFGLRRKPSTGRSD